MFENISNSSANLLTNAILTKLPAELCSEKFTFYQNIITQVYAAAMNMGNQICLAVYPNMFSREKTILSHQETVIRSDLFILNQSHWLQTQIMMLKDKQE